MSKRHGDFEGITWKHADVRQMEQIPSESVDVAFDKGTLDAMIYGNPWDPPDEVLENTGRYVQEVRSEHLLNRLRYHEKVVSHACLGLSCPQIRRNVYLYNIPAASLY